MQHPETTFLENLRMIKKSANDYVFCFPRWAERSKLVAR
jgi:hypothetical protein